MNKKITMYTITLQTKTKRYCLLFHSQDLISNSPFCLLHNSYDVSVKNVIFDQLIMPLVIYVFIYAHHLSAW